MSFLFKGEIAEILQSEFVLSPTKAKKLVASCPDPDSGVAMLGWYMDGKDKILVLLQDGGVYWRTKFSTIPDFDSDKIGLRRLPIANLL